MEPKKTSTTYSPEVRERAVRMVIDHEGEHASRWAAICSIAFKIGCRGETLRGWIRPWERDQGARDGMTTETRCGGDADLAELLGDSASAVPA